MANTISSQKRIRTAERRTEFNRFARTRLRNQIRSLRRALVAKDQSGLKEVFSQTFSVIDRAARKGQIKAGTAARYKSRLHTRLKAATGDVQK